MHDSGFHQNRASWSWQPGYLQDELESRVAFALGLQVGSRRADRRQRLDAAGGEAVDKRREREISARVEIRRLDAVAGRRNETCGRGRLGPALDSRSPPPREAPSDCITGLARQCGRNGERLLDPGRDIAACRVNELVTGAKRGSVKPERSAEDVKAGAGTQLAHKPDVEAAARR